MIVKHKKAPGQKFIKGLNLEQRSWLNGLGGAILFSLGQCLFAISWIRIYQNFDKNTWIFAMFIGLIITLLGILVMGQAMVFAAQIKARKYFKKRQKALLKKKYDFEVDDNLKIERKKS